MRHPSPPPRPPPPPPPPPLSQPLPPLSPLPSRCGGERCWGAGLRCGTACGRRRCQSPATAWPEWASRSPQVSVLDGVLEVGTAQRRPHPRQCCPAPAWTRSPMTTAVAAWTTRLSHYACSQDAKYVGCLVKLPSQLHHVFYRYVLQCLPILLHP